MIIREFKIYGFGKHCNLNMSFGDGVNVICGGNESGKSTVAAFIRAMLYGLSGRGVQNERKKYAPWNHEAKYGGELSFSHKGIIYRVVALFGESKREDVITLYNDTTGETIPVEASGTVGETVLEIPAETYDLTVYAAQMSSKPDLDNGNMDYLFDQLVKKSDNMKQSSSDITVGKRIKTAMDAISSPRTEKGALDILQNKKEEIDTALSKMDAIEAEAEQLRNRYDLLKEELKELKDQHVAEKADMSAITKAIETVSLHGEVKSCVEEINRCDGELADAGDRMRKIRRPATVIYLLLLLLTALCAAAVVFSSYLDNVKELKRIPFYLNALENKPAAYLVLGCAAFVLTGIYILIRSVGNGNIRERKADLFELEEELSKLLNTEYLYGAKYHAYNRDNINVALEQHTEEYRQAKFLLDNENQKNDLDSEYFTQLEDYTQKIAYTKASADGLHKTADELGDREELCAQRTELAKQIETYQRRWKGLELAKTVLEDAYQRWQADLGPVFGNEAGALLGQLTDQRYQEMRVARNFEITLRDGDGAMHHSFNYSGATVDQMYLALRLALVKIISSPESPLPLILDDPFVQYDTKRRMYAYDVIKRFAAENHAQILVTVCRNDGLPESFRVTELAEI